MEDVEEELYEYFWKHSAQAALDSGDKRGASIAHNALVKVAKQDPGLKAYLLHLRSQIEAL